MGRQRQLKQLINSDMSKTNHFVNLALSLEFSYNLSALTFHSSPINVDLTVVPCPLYYLPLLKVATGANKL